jgi:hypothetical protein
VALEELRKRMEDANLWLRHTMKALQKNEKGKDKGKEKEIKGKPVWGGRW